MEQAGPALPANLVAAREQLSKTVTDALATIEKGAAEGSQWVLQWLAGLGAAQIVSAAGIVGTEAAKALGLSAQWGALSGAVHAAVENSYGALLRLVGPEVVQKLGAQVAAWADSAVHGQALAPLLEKLYGTHATAQAVQGIIAVSTSDVSAFQAAISGVQALADGYSNQMDWVGKLQSPLVQLVAGGIALTPQGRLALAAFYVVVGAYVVLAGADFVDAPNLALLDHVPGVRRVVADALREN